MHANEKSKSAMACATDSGVWGEGLDNQAVGPVSDMGSIAPRFQNTYQTATPPQLIKFQDLQYQQQFELQQQQQYHLQQEAEQQQHHHQHSALQQQFPQLQQPDHHQSNASLIHNAIQMQQQQQQPAHGAPGQLQGQPSEEAAIPDFDHFYAGNVERSGSFSRIEGFRGRNHSLSGKLPAPATAVFQTGLGPRPRHSRHSSFGALAAQVVLDDSEESFLSAPSKMFPAGVGGQQQQQAHDAISQALNSAAAGRQLPMSTSNSGPSQLEAAQPNMLVHPSGATTAAGAEHCIKSPRKVLAESTIHVKPENASALPRGMPGSTSTTTSSSSTASSKASVKKPKRAAASVSTKVKISKVPKTGSLAPGEDPKTFSLSTKKRPLTSKFKGVCWYKRTKRWVEQVKMQGIRAHVGYYENELEAAAAYKTAMAEICSRVDENGKPLYTP